MADLSVGSISQTDGVTWYVSITLLVHNDFNFNWSLSVIAFAVIMTLCSGSPGIWHSRVFSLCALWPLWLLSLQPVLHPPCSRSILWPSLCLQSTTGQLAPSAPWGPGEDIERERFQSFRCLMSFEGGLKESTLLSVLHYLSRGNVSCLLETLHGFLCFTV